MEAMETTVPLQYNATTVTLQIRKSIPKPMMFPPDFRQADDLFQDDGTILVGDAPKENSASSVYMLIFIPIASIALLIGLVAVARWRYRVIHTRPVNGKCQTLDNNNVLPKSEEGQSPAEELVPLKPRNTSTSSSSSAVASRNILIEGSRPIAVSMRIVSDTQNQEILRTSRADLYCEIGSKEAQRAFDIHKDSTVNTVTFECEVLKDNKSTNLTSKEDESEKGSTKTEEPFPQRPRTLQVMTVVDKNTSANANNCSKGFPWTEQQWTPDADIVYEDTGSPVNADEIQKQGQDRLFPLMAKKKFKMKPKGLLERRGSNVALTISLKNDDKCTASPPPSSISPKPLVYLRTATAKLDPVQLHVKAADAQKLQEEFWEVPMNHPSEKHFSIPGYGTKNRYRSILPNPHSRVLLPVSTDGDPLSAYINANYVRGYPVLSETERRRQSEDGKENDARRMSIKRKAGFIATQGPMANTIVDFWKMVWRENSTAIVMITKLKEVNEKCSEYMPIVIGEKRTYGEFNLEVKNVRYADHYTVRTIEVLNIEEEGKVRTVLHYWYAEWLDHETPDKLRSLLTLVQEVDLRCPDMPNTDHCPVVVHCSAGIGRTGCFIAISIGCRQFRIEGKVDPLRIICQLRMDRGGLIQTWEQYQYVHVALSRYARILAGENVNTPLTGSSRTPDSRSSSRHTTPNSGDFKSPLNASRLFSPRLYSKSDLTTVEETENVASDGDQKPTPKSNDLEGSIFSPRLTNAKQKTHFSFSRTDDLNAPPDEQINGSSDGCDNADVEESLSLDISISKKTKTCPPPLRLKLKMETQLAPVRDENWLVNGHVVEVDKNFEDYRAVPKDTGIHTPKSPRQLVTVNDKSSEVGNEDLGKLKNILSPASNGLQTPDEQQQKLSVFMFPTPEK